MKQDKYGCTLCLYTLILQFGIRHTARNLSQFGNIINKREGMIFDFEKCSTFGFTDAKPWTTSQIYVKFWHISGPVPDVGVVFPKLGCIINPFQALLVYHISR